MNASVTRTTNNGTRLLAGLTGCVAAVAGVLGFGWPFLAVPALLIVGALLRGRWSQPGLRAMWVGAFVLTVWTVAYGGGILLSPPPLDRSGFSVLVITAATVLLVLICDVALLKEAIQRKSRWPAAST